MLEPPLIRCITIILSTMLCEFVKVDSRMVEPISLTTTILVTVASVTSIGQRCFQITCRNKSLYFIVFKVVKVQINVLLTMYRYSTK